MGDLGFSGLRILRDSDQGFEDVAIFQGASFYRSRARGQHFGVTARGLSIRTGDDPGEEFPLFREFWIEKPAPASNTLTMHALLDSASVTGAFRFTIRPLETTIIDTEMTLIARAATDKLGIGAMAASYLFSPLDHRRTDDWRAAVYEATGLQILSGKGEWLWRPVANRETLQISAFADQNPRGFGLSQRSRSFDAFYDDEGRWELRPTLWIEPIGDWGDGDLRLLEIPAPSENQRQYRRPVAPEGGDRRGRRRCRSPIASSGAGRRPRSRRSPSARRAAAARSAQFRRFTVEMTGRRLRRSRRRPRAAVADDRRQSRQDRLDPALPLQGSADRPRPVRPRPRLGNLFGDSSDAHPGQPAGQRDMALSMDSVTLTPAETATAATAGVSLGSSMPGYAPLAMPAQSFRKFSRRDRRKWIHPALVAHPGPHADSSSSAARSR